MNKARLTDWDLPETRDAPGVPAGTLFRYAGALAAISGGLVGIFAVAGNLSGHLPGLVERAAAAGIAPLAAILFWLGLHVLAMLGGLALLRLVGVGRALGVMVLTVLILVLIAGLPNVNSIDAAAPALIFASYLFSRLAGILTPRPLRDPDEDDSIYPRIEPGMLRAREADPNDIAFLVRAQKPQPPPKPPERRPLTMRRTTAALIVALLVFDSAIITLIVANQIWGPGPGQTTALRITEPQNHASAPQTARAAAPGATPADEPAPVALPPIGTALAPARFSDPFAYCAALGTIDAVDARYDGPQPPPALSQRLGEAANSASVSIVWRCDGGRVQACAQRYWPVCGQTPEMDDMIAFCRVIGQTGMLSAPGGPWTCDEGRPVLPADASWPVDARGFLPQAWSLVEAPAAG